MLRLLLAFAFATPCLTAQLRQLAAEDLPVRASVAHDLDELLTAGPRDLATTVALAATAGFALPSGSAARAMLDEALRTANLAGDPHRAQRQLRLALGDLVEQLTFKPLQQAELPQGFPTFQATGEIELRHYPAYRMVHTTMRGGSMGAFWPLFRHIEKNGIAMTTPVEMNWDDATTDKRPTGMAFLYGDPTTTPGSVADGVEVRDVPAAVVLSIGAIGEEQPARTAELGARLAQFVAASNGRLAIAGLPRLLVYNSPMVSRDQRYFEVQLPVRQVERRGEAVLR